ncbi:MAG: protein-tyrosine-phosphatase [Bacteroidia bacterium]|nr:protein-tyrosine-phosphatase [Bacteroidia bacterium]
MKEIQQYLLKLEKCFPEIPQARKKLLNQLADHCLNIRKSQSILRLMYVCVHNSRRSHFGQAWGAAAAGFYGFKDVFTYSGGTTVTAIHPNTVAALKRAGWKIIKLTKGKNPVYAGFFDYYRQPVMFYSKTVEHELNPIRNFTAIMTCSETEEECPLVYGADFRISLYYDDPKIADKTPQQNKTYDERCRQIALENLYLFHRILQKT